MNIYADELKNYLRKKYIETNEYYKPVIVIAKDETGATTLDNGKLFEGMYIEEVVDISIMLPDIVTP
jgi:hypothetical protein